MSRPESVSLALGSGGARGVAHIGVIAWLEEHNFKIESISGSSIGALIGAVYACGKLDEFSDWLSALDKMDIVRLLDISMRDGGFVKGDRIIAALKALVGEHQIEDLPIRFTAIAANIEQEREVWLNRGPLFEAVRASISLPLFFTPATVNGRRLLDGGILNPVPIAPTFSDATDLKIAVNLNGTPTAEPARRNKPAKPPAAGLKGKVEHFIDNLADKSFSKFSVDMEMIEIANQTFDAMQGAIARHKLAIYPPDIVIELPRNACGTLEFDRADELIDLGYAAAERAMRPLLEKE